MGNWRRGELKYLKNKKRYRFKFRTSSMIKWFLKLLCLINKWARIQRRSLKFKSFKRLTNKLTIKGHLDSPNILKPNVPLLVHIFQKSEIDKSTCKVSAMILSLIRISKWQIKVKKRKGTLSSMLRVDCNKLGRLNYKRRNKQCCQKTWKLNFRYSRLIHSLILKINLIVICWASPIAILEV